MIKLIRKNKAIHNLFKILRMHLEYFLDALTLSKNFMGSSFRNSMKYRIILLVHSIEKGLAMDSQKQFGYEKINDLISIYESNKIYLGSSMEHNMILDALNAWTIKMDKLIIDEKYTDLASRVKKILATNLLPTNSFAGTKVTDLNSAISPEQYEFFLKNNRTSVRKYISKDIPEASIVKAVNMACLSPSACNRQFIRSYYVSTKSNNRDSIKNIMKGLSGFEFQNTSFFIVTYDMSAIQSALERNQGHFNAGLYSQNLSNALTTLNISNCFVQWGNSSSEETKIKRAFDIPSNERIATLLACGFAEPDSLIPLSKKRESEIVLRIMR